MDDDRRRLIIALAIALASQQEERIEGPIVTTKRIQFDSYPERNFRPKFRFTRTEILDLYRLFRIPDQWLFE